jgi:hypothetical protein
MLTLSRFAVANHLIVSITVRIEEKVDENGKGFAFSLPGLKAKTVNRMDICKEVKGNGLHSNRCFLGSLAAGLAFNR